MPNANDLQQDLIDLADLAIAARDANAQGDVDCMEGNIANAIEAIKEIAWKLRFEI